MRAKALSTRIQSLKGRDARIRGHRRCCRHQVDEQGSVSARYLGRQEVPVRASWTHGYLVPSGLHSPIQTHLNQALSAGCPGWCNLPTATLVAHSASWSRTLAALRPKALPFPPFPFQPLVASSAFALGASLLAVSFVPFSQANPSFSFPLRFRHPTPAIFPRRRRRTPDHPPRLADRPSHSRVAVSSDLWRPGRRTLAKRRLPSPVPMPALS
jgi:hypothetical protein